MEGLTDEKGGEAERARSGEGCAGGPQGGQQDVAFGRKGPAGNEEENGSGEWLCGERWKQRETKMVCDMIAALEKLKI